MLHFGILVCVMIAACQCLLPYGDPCLQSTMVDKTLRERTTTKMTAKNNCTEGEIYWHYPNIRESLEVGWKPINVTSDFKVCLRLARTSLFSFMGILVKAGDTAGQRVTYNDLYADDATPAKDDKFCVGSDTNGEVSMVFSGREWLYMATIDYVIE